MIVTQHVVSDGRCCNVKPPQIFSTSHGVLGMHACLSYQGPAVAQILRHICLSCVLFLPAPCASSPCPQAEEAARRAEQQAAEAARRAAEREERLRRAAEYQEPEWVRASEAAQQEDEETEVR
jgi:hypothetical protein